MFVFYIVFYVAILIVSMTSSVRASSRSSLSSRNRGVSHIGKRTTTGSRSVTSKTSSISRSVRRFSKKSLRAVLLSHMFHTGLKIVIICGVLSASLYGAYAYIGKSVENEVVISKSQIVRRIATHMQLPDGDVTTVVRVEDSENLKKQNSFYKDVEPGDYIVVYPTLAIIYDLKDDKIRASKHLNVE